MILHVCYLSDYLNLKIDIINQNSVQTKGGLHGKLTAAQMDTLQWYHSYNNYCTFSIVAPIIYFYGQ